MVAGMGSCSRLTLLLSTPCFSLLFHPRPSHFRLTRLSLSTRLSFLPIKAAANHFHNVAATDNNSGGNYVRDANYVDDSHNHFSNSRASPQHPWAEWSNLIHEVYTAGYFTGVHQDDEFVAYETLSEEYIRAATACLGFARNRSDMIRFLSRKDIEVIVENGTPFLFRSAFDSSRRLKSFLGSGSTNVAGSGTAEMVDLMKYLLSYASNPTVSVSSEINKSYTRDKIESSVRNLLGALAQMSGNSGRAQEQYQVPHVQRPQNIEMKRGDWICPRCTFMNFARNQKCLDCEETRPKRVLTGGEWECPQCDFYNYGRNMVCLKCECKRPGEVSSGMVNPRPAYNEDYTVASRKLNLDSSNQDKAEKWFNSISQQSNNSELPDEDFPDIMPLRKGENKFVVSTRKTPLERRLENSNSGQTRGDIRTVDSSAMNRSLDQILGPISSRIESRYNANYTPFVPLPADMFAKKPQSPASDGTNPVLDSKESKANAAREYSQETMPMQNAKNRLGFGQSSFTSTTYRRQTPVEQASSYDSKLTSFVPLPSDYFANKLSTEATVKDSTIGTQSSSPQITETRQTPTSSQTSGRSDGNCNKTTNIGGQNSNIKKFGGESGGWNGKSLEGSAVKETDPLDMSEEAKAERWFKRVAQIKDISELSEIPDEDFPSIMPMRKGVNRFVVSKRKTPMERRLTSPQYRKNLPVFKRSDLPPLSPNNQDNNGN